MKALTIPSSKNAKRRLAQPCRLFQHRVEYRRQIAGRGIDDLQYLSGRGLLFQCFVRFGQKPRVLHCDDRLGGEVFEQGDLFLGERSNLLSHSDNIAE